MVCLIGIVDSPLGFLFHDPQDAVLGFINEPDHLPAVVDQFWTIGGGDLDL